MKLTKDQIQFIDTYLEKSGITWFDLKLELVDHFVTKIEAILTDQPNLNITEAIHRVKLEFGTKGFRPIIVEKTKHIEKQFFKDVFKFFIAFFSIPKILITILLTFILNTLYLYIEIKEIFFLGLISILFLFSFYSMYKSFRRRSINNKKHLTLQHMFQFATVTNSLAIIINSLYSFAEKSLLNDEGTMLFTVLWLVVFLFTISIEHASNKIYKKQKLLYTNYIS